METLNNVCHVQFKHQYITLAQGSALLVLQVKLFQSRKENVLGLAVKMENTIILILKNAFVLNHNRFKIFRADAYLAYFLDTLIQ